MAHGYGVLIVLIPTDQDYESLPATTPPVRGELTSSEQAMRDVLTGIMRQADPIAGPYGGRTLVDHSPRAQPSREQVNVWIDEAGDTLPEAMGKAGECAAALEQADLIILSLELFNWERTAILA